MKKYLLILTTIFVLTVPAMAEQVKAKPLNKTKNVDGDFSILTSHIKSIGTIGKTNRYHIVSARIRGLDSPNISALLAYDSETDTLAVLASGVEPGLGVAIVNGGATVGGSFLFGSKLRPDRTSVSNGSSSQAEANSDADMSTSTSTTTTNNGSPKISKKSKVPKARSVKKSKPTKSPKHK